MKSPDNSSQQLLPFFPGELRTFATKECQAVELLTSHTLPHEVPRESSGMKRRQKTGPEMKIDLSRMLVCNGNVSTAEHTDENLLYVHLDNTSQLAAATGISLVNSGSMNVTFKHHCLRHPWSQLAAETSTA